MTRDNGMNDTPVRILFEAPPAAGTDSKIRHTGDKTQELEELIKVFLPPDRFTVVDDTCGEPADIVVPYDPDGNQRKRYLFDALGKLTGETPAWGIMTGVRPVKKAGELVHDEQQRTVACIAFCPAAVQYHTHQSEGPGGFFSPAQRHQLSVRGGIRTAEQGNQFFPGKEGYGRLRLGLLPGFRRNAAGGAQQAPVRTQRLDILLHAQHVLRFRGGGCGTLQKSDQHLLTL